MKNKIRDIILLFIPLRFAVKLLSLVRNVYDRLTFLDRVLIANRYIQGQGIEIGALHAPLVVPPGAKVRYVDRMSVSKLREQYPELKKYDLVDVDIVADGETLSTIEESTQDFVIANHFLEHCENPILALTNMFRVLNDGGILYLAIPDMRFTFDADRPVTSLQHVMDDYLQGPEISREDHYREQVRFVHKLAEHEIEGKVREMMEIRYSIHFHAWTQLELMELLLHLKDHFSIRFDVEFFLKKGREVIFVLKKN